MPSDFVFCPICGAGGSGNIPTQVNDGTGRNQSGPAQPNHNPNYNSNPPAQPNHNPNYNSNPPAQPNHNPNYNSNPPAQPSYNPNSPQPTGASYKVESTTILLALLPGLIGLSGIGHIYASKVGKGVAILVGGMILDIIGLSTLVLGLGTLFFGIGFIFAGAGGIFLLIYFGIWIWQIFDARSACREYNEYFAQHGQPPW